MKKCMFNLLLAFALLVGICRLEVNALPIVDGLDDSYDDPQSISNGSSQSGTVSCDAYLTNSGMVMDKNDYFRFRLSSDAEVTIQVSGQKSLSVVLYNGSGTNIGTGTRIRKNLSAGSYTVCVSDNNSGGKNRYTILMSYCTHYNYSSTTIPGSCVEDGYTFFSCNSCGKTWTQVIPASHTPGNWEETTKPTCTKEGIRTAKCTQCGKTLTEKINMLPHTYGGWTVTQKPSCSEEGQKIKTCACGHRVVEAIPILEHDYSDWILRQSPTCVMKGKQEKICVFCEHRIEETLPMTDHKYRDWAVIKAPTCEETGVKAQFCRYCDKQITEDVPSIYHTYGEWTVTKESTCTEEGAEYRICEHCGKKEEKTIPPLGHDYDTGSIVRNANCSEEGVIVYTCLRCIDRQTEAIPETDHNYGDWIVTQEATCAQNGIRVKICVDCGGTLTDDNIRSLEHSYGEAIVMQEATCYENGFCKKICTVCGYETVENLYKLAHTYDGVIELSTAPQKNRSGELRIYCSVEGCNQYKKEWLPGLDTESETYKVPGYVDRIGSYAFSRYLSIEAVEIPKGVTQIGEYAFCECTNLKSVRFYGNVDSIGSHAFANCTGLEEITLPSRLNSIGDYAFFNCKKLSEVEIPDGVDSIANGTFSECRSLKRVTIPDSVTSIGDEAFANCSLLRDLTIPDSVTSIGEMAFDACYTITNITIPESVTFIGGRAFQGCEGLTRICFTGNVPDIGKSQGAKAVFVWGTDKERIAYYPANNSTWENETDPYLYQSFSWDENLKWESCEHSFDGVTCTNAGTCTKCGAITGASGHVYGEDSCINTTLCSICGESLNATGHSFIHYQPDNNASCTQDGTKTAKCERCEALDTVSDGGSALGHDFTDYEINIEPTCTTGGTKTAVCNRCEAKDVAVIPALTHAFTNYVSDGEPDCDSSCTETGTCERCGEENIRVVYALEHDFADYVTENEATCTANGIKVARCSRCDIRDVEIIQATGHAFTDYESNEDASCVADGTESRKCNVCGVVETRTMAQTALGTHSFTNYVYNNDATCVNYGTKTAKCDRCDICDTVANLDYLAEHTEQSVENQHKEPTCTEIGILAGKECSVCAEILAMPEIIPASGHTEETMPRKEASCTEEGVTEGKKCAVCEVILQEQASIPVVPHNWRNEICTVCGTKSENWQPVVRLAGTNRFDTAFVVANRMKANLGIEKFDAVVVASGTNFADALSGSYLAAVKNAPILLSFTTDAINNGVKDYIRGNLNEGGTVYILGGESAVPASFETGLEGFEVKRLAGGNRFETNLMILEEAEVGDKPVLVCTGLGFADSLSASAAKLPILLVWNDLTDGQKALLDNLDGNKLYIIGGESAVSTGMEEQLKAYGETERVAGGNRFETSVAIAETFFSSPESAVLAYAWNFPDGLCGGPLAATMDAPLILTMDKYEATAAAYIQGKGIKNGIILGGESLISQETVNNIFN